MKHARLFLACMLWTVIATALKAQNTVAAGEFYLMNVGTGLYLKFGGAGNAKAAEGHAGVLVKLTKKSDNGYTIQTKDSCYLDDALNMTSKTSTEWIFTAKGNNSYEIKTKEGGILASKNNLYGLLGLESQMEANKQRWILISKDQFSNSLDMTPWMPAASFDINDEVDVWKNADADANIEICTDNEGSDAEEHYLKITGKAEISITIGDPNKSGTVLLIFDAKKEGTSEAKVGITFQNTANAIITSENWNRYAISAQRKGGGGSKPIIITINNSDGSVLCLDNFELKYAENKHETLDNLEASVRKEYKDKARSEFESVSHYIQEYYGDGYKALESQFAALENNLAETSSFTIETYSEYKEILTEINKLKEDAKLAHRQANQDISDNNAIFNPGFELGNLYGWVSPEGSAATERENVTAITGATGSHLFLGTNISQQVSNLPTGKYTLSAKVASTNGANITLTATHGSQTWKSSQQTTNAMTEIKIEDIIVYNGKFLIQVSGDQEFYADDFSLSFKELILHESSTIMFEPKDDKYESILLTRNIKAGVWNTFVVPFDMEIPAGWEVKTLTGSTLNNENISLTFSDASSIEAGKPYMVRVSEAVTEITLENVNLSTTLNNTTTDHVEFIGTYTNGYVPEGAFFISSNTFYRSAAENSNTMKGYRAYIKVKEGIANARSLTYRTDDETGITEESTGEVTVVAIYNMQGVRLDDMQEGINILQMSNGSTIKVVIK